MKTVSACLLAAVIACAPVAQAQKITRVYVYSYGNASCGDWIAERKAPAADADVGLAWVLGYLTGIEEGRESRRIQFRHPDADAIAAWVDNYCQANPLDNLFQAAAKLNHDLMVR